MDTIHSDKEQPDRCYGYDYEKKFFHLDELILFIDKGSASVHVFTNAKVMFSIYHVSSESEKLNIRYAFTWQLSKMLIFNKLLSVITVFLKKTSLR